MTFEFANPGWLYWIPSIAGVFCLAWIYYGFLHRRLVKKIGRKVMPMVVNNHSLSKKKFSLLLQFLGLSLLFVALARPQAGQRQQKVKSEGIELIIAVDVSRSMLAEDLKPSRLELAKKELIRFVDMGSNHRIGLVAFAGSAALVSPITSDKSAINLFIDSLTPDTVSSQGTNFYQALKEAQDAFKRGGTEADEQTSVAKAIIVVSDGEDHEAKAIEIAQSIREEGIRIFTVLVGTEAGAPIPTRDRRGELDGFKRGKDGKVIVTQAKGGILENLAKAGEGGFYSLTFGGTTMNQLSAELERLEKAEFESSEVTEHDELFQWPLLLGFILLLAELLYTEHKKSYTEWKGRVLS